jgi:phosphoribosylaminoimidazole-succinocarboxamide synthase
MNITTIRETNFPGLKLMNRGKVRDIYDFDDRLLIVATDRVSAFDVVMDDPIPDKGRILTSISNFWFEHLKKFVDNHIISTDPNDFPDACRPYLQELAGRSVLVKKATPLEVECIVRGYIAGSGWKEYQEKGTVCEIQLPAGLVESQKLPVPIFTPSTKAQQGLHDENISFVEASEILGDKLAEKVREISIELYQAACQYAESKGIIIADTKFEFGIIESKIFLIDEVLTPDSSRFWPMDQYKPGEPQPSFDKQYLRDYLDGLRWNKQPPPPKLPPEVIAITRKKYLEALARLITD